MRTFFLLLAITISQSLYAQNIHPKVQAMLDEMNSWMQNEIQSKGTVDAEELNRRNARIKAVQDSLKTVKPSGELTGEAVSKRKLTKTLFAGSSVVVPENVEWRITGMYVKSDDNPYRVQVKSITFQPVYRPGEKITAPVMSSESSLLTSDAMSASYDIDIEESVFEKK
ncbi:MAG: hypothetical protein IT223_00795 [Crocinitomicaceae bacterium]|nr:hypothetical protein [Crocinitomicaceae bacterium]